MSKDKTLRMFKNEEHKAARMALTMMAETSDFHGHSNPEHDLDLAHRGACCLGLVILPNRTPMLAYNPHTSMSRAHSFDDSNPVGTITRKGGQWHWVLYSDAGRVTNQGYVRIYKGRITQAPYARAVVAMVRAQADLLTLKYEKT